MGRTEHSSTPKGTEASGEDAESIHSPNTLSTNPDTEVRTNVEPNGRSENPCLTVDALPDDLKAVIRAWDDLPEAVRRGILAMIESSRGD